jgi:uncharacterized protein (TIGR02246 family)
MQKEIPMKSHWSVITVIVCCLAFPLLQCNQQQSVSDTGADESAFRSINNSWFQAYNAGDVDAIVALYAEDAVVSAPGAPAARGHAAIRELLTNDVTGAKAAAVSLKEGSTSDVGVSGDLGWEWGTFTVVDESGTTVDSGKYVSVFARRDGKWLIIRDIWNSDTPNQMPEME